MKYIDLRNQKINKWTILSEDPISKYRQILWKCKCDCGKEKYVQGKHLRSGKSKCCGCEGNKKIAERSKNNKYTYIHGLRDHPLRAIWKAMNHRCYIKTNRFYKNYGGRGIKVCEEWKLSLLDFYKWSIESGWKKGLSIDRIDNDGNYEPKNCRWITISENSSRKRNKNKASVSI